MVISVIYPVIAVTKVSYSNYWISLVNMIMLILVCYHHDTDRTRCVSSWEDLSPTEKVTKLVNKTAGTDTDSSDSHSDNRQIARMSESGAPRGESR